MGSDRSILLVTDVLRLSGIEHQIEYRCNEAVNSAGYDRKEEVATGSRGKAFGLKRTVVDDDTADESQEKCQQKTNKFGVIHDKTPFIYEKI